MSVSKSQSQLAHIPDTCHNKVNLVFKKMLDTSTIRIQGVRFHKTNSVLEKKCWTLVVYRVCDSVQHVLANAGNVRCHESIFQHIALHLKPPTSKQVPLGNVRCYERIFLTPKSIYLCSKCPPPGPGAYIWPKGAFPCEMKALPKA